MKTYDLRILEEVSVISPEQLRQEIVVTPKALETIIRTRKIIEDIKDRKSSKKLVFCGPCSVHHEKAILEYADLLVELQGRTNNLVLVLRHYIDKPRTGNNWMGWLNDWKLDKSYDIEGGIRKARQMIIRIAEKGIGVVVEFVDVIAMKYFADVVSFAAIGAKTSSSQIHQILASGLSMPFGVKNDCSGDIDPVISTHLKAAEEQHFLTVSDKGEYCKKKTAGNPYGFTILRGSKARGNYDSASIKEIIEKLQEKGIKSDLIIDCSHGNSKKKNAVQRIVWKDVMTQIVNGGNGSIVGLMLESNLFEGSQKNTGDLSTMKYGVSITDACIGWQETEELVLSADEQLAP